MTKAELIDMVAEQVGDVSKAKIGEVYGAIFATIARALEVDGRYAVSDFGSFDVKERAARTGRNPSTGAEIQIAASKAAGFKPAAALKDRLNATMKK